MVPSFPLFQPGSYEEGSIRIINLPFTTDTSTFFAWLVFMGTPDGQNWYHPRFIRLNCSPQLEELANSNTRSSMSSFGFACKLRQELILDTCEGSCSDTGGKDGERSPACKCRCWAETWSSLSCRLRLRFSPTAANISARHLSSFCLEERNSTARSAMRSLLRSLGSLTVAASCVRCKSAWSLLSCCKSFWTSPNRCLKPCSVSSSCFLSLTFSCASASISACDLCSLFSRASISPRNLCSLFSRA
mmetsp:Transcript_96891/g.273878  ORF Transcript_96891/g.273878 Transcript_96891/m.273878 type:complete len:246 (+) Transcript_96891:94-831(+)